ncbi:hypothetical protein [Kutzneria sp. 744]|uniref:RCC1 domain-containing protein n=1 Tax=Kutzneria sp. (strain 744) TaxID=345341 RepID=UPI0003EED233|nr:hypothetical protein [Kutzneria sp. 744]EWM18678.1 S-layer protein [Kutzneria sp. 744]
MRRIGYLALAAGLVGALITAGAGPAVSAATPTGAPFTPISPVRVLDTRDGTGTAGATTPVGPGSTISLDLSARVPASTTAVVLNVTGTEPTASTYVTVFPSGTNRTSASNLNLAAGETRPNLVTVALGADRKVNLFNFQGTVHLVADLTGYYGTDAAGKYMALTSPTRVLDTRVQIGPNPPNPVGSGGVVTVDLSDRVPASATAVTFNLTGTDASTGTFITAWPAGTAMPNTSNLNLTGGATSPNLVTIALGAGRKFSLANHFGTVDLVVDLAGFYTPDYGSLFAPITPTRVLDTRDGTGGATGPVGPGGEVNLTLGANVPASATGAVLNLTGAEPTTGTYVAARPTGQGREDGSNLNLTTGQTAANLVAVGTGVNSSVTLYNANGNVQLIADLSGYFFLPPKPCASGCVYAWGSSYLNQLGTGAVGGSATPLPVYGLSGVKAISGSHALLADGTVWSWGFNYGGELGNGWWGGESLIPVPAIGLDHVTALSGTVALKSDGTVWSWGSGAPSGGHYQPGQVPGLSGVKAVASGLGVSYALKNDGTVWSWGSNGFGALGTGSDTPQFAGTPVQVSGLSDIRAIESRGYGAIALKNDGTVWTWGDNRQGQLGNGTVGGVDSGCEMVGSTAPNCYSNLPAQVKGIGPATTVGMDGNNTFAALADGSTWGWGSQYEGATGTGVDCECFSGTPKTMSGLINVQSITGMGNGGYALDTAGRVWAWGRNSEDELGPVDGHPARSAVPLRLNQPTGVSAISAGVDVGYALVP